MEETACRLCGANDVEMLWMAHDLSYGGPGTFPLVRCRQCGLVYLRIRPSRSEMDRYYPPQYSPYRTAIQDEPFFLMRYMRRRKMTHRRRIVERYSPCAPGRILDVGCSTGIFLDDMRRAGWQTWGVELSSEAARYAQARFGLRVAAGELQEAGLPSQSFDVLTFWNVIEHTFDPLATLQEANRLLVRGGVVVMALPNWESFDHRLFGPAWIGYDCPRHLYAFPLAALQRLHTAAGFEIVDSRCDMGGYFFFYASLEPWLNLHVQSGRLRRAIKRVLEFPGVRLPFEPFFSLLDRMGVGGSRVVVARKVDGVSEGSGRERHD